MNQFNEQIKKYIEGDIEVDQINNEIETVIMSLIYRYSFESNKLTQEDLIQEAWLIAMTILQQAKDGGIKMRDPFNYIYTSIKNKLIKLSTNDYTETDLPEDMEVEDSQDNDYNYELIYTTFIDYLKYNRNDLFYKEYNTIILQEYINKFENQIYSPNNVNRLNEVLHLDLPRTYTHSSIKRVKYRLNTIYEGIRQDLLKGIPTEKIMGESYG